MCTFFEVKHLEISLIWIWIFISYYEQQISVEFVNFMIIFSVIVEFKVQSYLFIF